MTSNIPSLIQMREKKGTVGEKVRRTRAVLSGGGIWGRGGVGEGVGLVRGMSEVRLV